MGLSGIMNASQKLQVMSLDCLDANADSIDTMLSKGGKATRVHGAWIGFTSELIVISEEI